MGLLDIVPAGVVTGDNLRKLFSYGIVYTAPSCTFTFADLQHVQLANITLPFLPSTAPLPGMFAPGTYKWKGSLTSSIIAQSTLLSRLLVISSRPSSSSSPTVVPHTLPERAWATRTRKLPSSVPLLVLRYVVSFYHRVQNVRFVIWRWFYYAFA